ncbi:hypothetical protein [Sphingomonas sp. VNH70]|uniref:hypothetical protein n=1 Tax=Sphingomonas silueang TaxID=3156617 RepID=UPI0032B60A7B
MSNIYTKVAFGLSITTLQAQNIETATMLEFDEALDAEGTERLAAYADLGPEFAEIFPPGDEDPFATFLDLFDDPEHVQFGVDFVTAGPLPDGSVRLSVTGDHADVSAIGRLLHRVLFHDADDDALPFGFEYARTCDRHRLGEFGGGYVVATREGVRFEDTALQLQHALQVATGDVSSSGQEDIALPEQVAA